MFTSGRSRVRGLGLRAREAEVLLRELKGELRVLSAHPFHELAVHTQKNNHLQERVPKMLPGRSDVSEDTEHPARPGLSTGSAQPE